MGPLFYRLARRSTTDFFLSGRDLPWWLSGTSMVATTFSAGVPLLITGFIWTNGVFMNWWWWSFALSNVLTVVFFARLWRRAKVTTDVEFSELRYGGRPGAWLRGFRALYFGGIVNTF
ncbi:MAG: sodium:proline symporter, partial [Gemmatimonadetes bacterium]|nr:sodium:proline symporter [Gemmatimonadota bacterium]